MNGSIEINRRRVGRGEPTYIVAEISANHNGSFEQALPVVDGVAAEAEGAVTVGDDGQP